MNLSDTEKQIETYHNFTYGEVLADEGIANDISSTVNRARRNAGLNVSDRIRLFIYSGEIVSWAIYWNKLLLNKTTLADEIFVNDVIIGETSVTLNFEPGEITIPSDASLTKDLGSAVGGNECNFPVYIRIEKI